MAIDADVQALDSAFLDILACPQCLGPLAPSISAIDCARCHTSFPVVDGIPILTVARPESEAQIAYQCAFFDNQFSTFSSYQLENWRKSYLQRIFPALRVETRPNLRYLDIGVGGSGYTVIEAARKGCMAIGCDLSLEGVRRAARFARDEGVDRFARFVVCSAEHLPFNPGTFDAVSCVAVLEHLVRDDLAAAGIGRVTASGGRFFVTVPNTFSQTNPLFWLPSWLNDRRHGHLRHYTAATLTRLFDQDFIEFVPTFTARTAKGIQLALAALRACPDSVWWRLEGFDLRNSSHARGAQLHMTGTRK
ncbi:MAG: methyltransferase domain-containing protein [Vulcanimicrobiaceae bacterium]